MYPLFLSICHLKVRVVFVNGIISEMHTRITDILLCGLNILLSAHANQSIVKEVHSQGLHRAHKTVDTEVKLVTIQ